MSLRTKEDYFESIRKQNTELYLMGERVEEPASHPLIKPALEAIGLVYELSLKDEYKDYMTAWSPFTNEPVNRFLHIMQDRDDLAKRFYLGRYLVRRHGGCIGARCVSTAALNSLFAVTFDMDRKLGTSYHSKFLEFLKHVQKEDLAVCGAMMDVKGDRSISPGRQHDHDSYVHIAEKTEKGIVVRGAKASISGAAIANEIVVVPCTALQSGEKNYAVSFAIPTDTPGVIHIAEAPAPNMRRLVGQEMDFGNARYGVHGSTRVIFDDVFVPYERVFMCGEWEFAGDLVNYFALLQRLATSGCKTGHRDLLLGASAVIAEYNGVGKARHINEKLSELYFQSELSAGCALASVFNAFKSPSGVFFPDPLYINIAKLQGVKAIWDGTFKMADIAGGLVCTAPTAKDLQHEKIGPLLQKYLRAKQDVPAEHRIRMMRLIEYLSGQASVIPIESTHGAGSPQAQKIAIQNALYRVLDQLKRDARIMAGIEETE